MKPYILVVFFFFPSAAHGQAPSSCASSGWSAPFIDVQYSLLKAVKSGDAEDIKDAVFTRVEVFQTFAKDALTSVPLVGGVLSGMTTIFAVKKGDTPERECMRDSFSIIIATLKRVEAKVDEAIERLKRIEHNQNVEALRSAYTAFRATSQPLRDLRTALELFIAHPTIPEFFATMKTRCIAHLPRTIISAIRDKLADKDTPNDKVFQMAGCYDKAVYLHWVSVVTATVLEAAMFSQMCIRLIKLDEAKIIKYTTENPSLSMDEMLKYINESIPAAATDVNTDKTMATQHVEEVMSKLKSAEDAQEQHCLPKANLQSVMQGVQKSLTKDHDTITNWGDLLCCDDKCLDVTDEGMLLLYRKFSDTMEIYNWTVCSVYSWGAMNLQQHDTGDYMLFPAFPTQSASPVCESWRPLKTEAMKALLVYKGIACGEKVRDMELVLKHTFNNGFKIKCYNPRCRRSSITAASIGMTYSKTACEGNACTKIFRGLHLPYGERGPCVCFDKDYGVKWSESGRIPGMHCVKAGGGDFENVPYFCVAKNSPWQLVLPVGPTPDLSCIRAFSEGDRHSSNICVEELQRESME